MKVLAIVALLSSVALGFSKCPFIKDCPYLEKHHLNVDVAANCPLSKHCPHLHPSARGREISSECPYLQYDLKPIKREDGSFGCPLEGKCPYYDQMKQAGAGEGMLKCPMVSHGCPHYGGHGFHPHELWKGAGPGECPYLAARQRSESKISVWYRTAQSVLFPHAKSQPTLAALTAVAYISLIPISMLLLVPLNLSRRTMNVGIAFAAGGILGDVFLHLLPHAFDPHPHHEHSHGEFDHHGHDHEEEHVHDAHHHELHNQHNHDHSRGLFIGLSVLVGFGMFFIIERLMRAFHIGDEHSHGHSSSEKKDQQTVVVQDKSSTHLKLAAYLNLLADGMHNFTDGLAIAAAFIHSPTLGASTTLACFLHEIPHEVGDYAILLRSGFTKSQAIGVQILTAMGAAAGALVGGYLGTLGGLEQWVLAFTAGGFVYVATVGIIPELVEEDDRDNETTRQDKKLDSDGGVGWAMAEMIAMTIGVALMAWIAIIE